MGAGQAAGVLYVPGRATVREWENARWRMHRYALGRGYQLVRVFDVDGRPATDRVVYRVLAAWLPVLDLDAVLTCGPGVDHPLLDLIAKRHDLRVIQMPNEAPVFPSLALPGQAARGPRGGALRGPTSVDT